MNPFYDMSLRWPLAAMLGLRVLAVLDAMLLTILVGWACWQFPDRGGFLGTVAVAFAGYFGLKRLYRVFFEFDQYRWMALRLGKVVLVIVAFHYLFRAWDWIRAV